MTTKNERRLAALSAVATSFATIVRGTRKSYLRAKARVLLAAVMLALVPLAARAQQPGVLDVQQGWSFSLAPYLWLPTINTRVNYSLADGRGSRLPTDVSIGPGEYISGLHFAVQGAAEARYDRFSILTDFVYLDSSGGRSTLRVIDAPGLAPLLLTPGLQTGFSVTLKAAIWTQTGGYTVLAGDWGNFDVFAGFRLLTLNITTNYGLSTTVTGPLGNTFGLTGRFGSLSASTDIWNGIAGLRGRIRLGDTAFFVPYYFDIGGGGSSPTWQIAPGVGYQWGRIGVSATYRYLSFQQSNRNTDAHLTMHGPMLLATIRF